MSVKAGVYENNQLEFGLNDLRDMPEPSKILLVTPAYFEVVDVKNPYMEGQEGAINKELAWEQWDSLHAIYKHFQSKDWLSKVAVLDGAEGLEDMVFSANQSLPWLTADGKKKVILSNMRFPSRQREVVYFEAFYKKEGYEILHLPEHLTLEGNGDMIAHSGKSLLWGGYGHRTKREALEAVAALLDVPVIPLKLVSEHFYHLDTCFVAIDEYHVMLCPEAFDKDSLEAIGKIFKHVHHVPREEAIQFFSLNALTLRMHGLHRKAILQKGSTLAKSILESCDFECVEVETGEFMKSGGSVFCMKMMYY